jgi:hypothetical protein
VTFSGMYMVREELRIVASSIHGDNGIKAEVKNDRTECADRTSPPLNHL